MLAEISRVLDDRSDKLGVLDSFLMDDRLRARPSHHDAGAMRLLLVQLRLPPRSDHRPPPSTPAWT
jgi:hypothetical protein